MSFFKSLLKRFSLSQSGKIRAYETAVLDCVQNALTASSAGILTIQRKRINLIQRHAADKEVNFYSIENGKVSDMADMKFANTSDELLLAVARLKPRASSARPIRTEVWLVRGQLFSLMFQDSPLLFRDEVEFDVECQIVTDPMLQASPVESSCPRGSGNEILLRFVQEFPVSDLKPPAPPSVREEMRSRFAFLPDDFLQLLAETDGFEVQRWRFLGSHARFTPREEDNLLIVVERDDNGNISIRMKPAQPVAYLYCDYDNEMERVCSGSLVEVLADVLRAGRTF